MSNTWMTHETGTNLGGKAALPWFQWPRFKDGRHAKSQQKTII